MDGFVPRRPQRSLMRSQYESKPQNTLGRLGGQELDGTNQLHTGDGKQALRLHHADQHEQQRSSLKENISQSLKAIDAQPVASPRQKRRSSRKKRRIVRLIILVVVLAGLAFGGTLLYKAWVATGKVFGGGTLLDLFQMQPLKVDQHGRSNLLIIGTTDEDPNRPGAALADSILVLSVDQKKHNAYMFSVPRDLYVQYGRACSSGYAGKINEYFACSATGQSDEAERQRLDATRQFMGKLFGMDIQYAAHVNSNVLRDAVNAVGGVTVQVQSDDPRGVFDPSIDWMCYEKGLTAAQRKQRCPTGHFIDFKNGPVEMDGDKALWFARARGAFGGSYGLAGSNFAREKNQQLVIKALKDKATSSGTLTDFGKVTGLIDAMGKNLRTNIDAKEVRTIMDVASKIDVAHIHSLSFIEEGNVLMINGSIGGASIVRPAAGLYDYSKIRAFLKTELFGSALAREKARVVVLNAGAASGAAQREADELTELGFTIVSVGNAPKEQAGRSAYQLGDDTKPQAKTALTERYGAVTSDRPPLGSLPAADFVVVLGR